MGILPCDHSFRLFQIFLGFCKAFLIFTNFNEKFPQEEPLVVLVYPPLHLVISFRMHIITVAKVGWALGFRLSALRNLGF